jgi:sugar lactone lactonase YvrE
MPGSFGMRFRANGKLAVALPNEGAIVDVSPDGKLEIVTEGLDLPNGVYPDSDGNLWITEMSGDRVIKVDSKGKTQVIASGAKAAAPNGIVFDEQRGSLFYTQFGTGILMRVDLGTDADADDPVPDAVEVATLPNARPDGLALDTCGNIYAVDNANARLFRVALDKAGKAVKDPELLAKFPTSVANPLFGRGKGFAETSLFVVGVAGDLYEIPLSVKGAPVAEPKNSGETSPAPAN